MAESRIKSMKFGLISPDQIKDMGKVRIVTSELYDADGYPVEGGVMDPRLGVIDPGLKCRTCNGGIDECPGHFGYLELAKPILNVLYIKSTFELLKVTCRKCNKIMIEAVKNSKSFEQPNKCPHCKALQKKIKFSKPYTFYEDKEEITSVDIRERFENIPNVDLKKIGFGGGRPEWMILTLFPIPPVTTRPSITLEGGERSEDDLTHKLVDIVRINQSLKENMEIGAPEFIISDLCELVQYHTSTYFDNELSGTPLARHRSGRPLKGLVQRLKGKEGRIRGNLLGKRVNFCARTVISPDAKISINEVGIPKIVAKELTIPEYVTKTNMLYIKNLFKNNLVNYVVRPDGRRIKITKTNKKEILETIALDWVIERQLKDNDIILFNRQPSLHKASIMAHRVKIMPYKTFRLTMQVCPPYNADFDGDEMNIHVLQTDEARTEATMLMEVKNNIMSPKFGGPAIGLDMDQISGIYLLTKEDVVLSKEAAAQLLADADIDVELPEKDTFTGKEIFSLLLPEGFSMPGFKAKRCKNCITCTEEECEYDSWVRIKDGKIKTGTIDAASVGAMKGKILKAFQTYTDSDTLKDFIDQTGKLAVSYLTKRGMSIGISDLDLPTKAENGITNEIDLAIQESNNLIKKFNNKQIKILPGMTPKESLEAQIMNALANGVSRASDIVSDNIIENDLIHMAISGAKGSIINSTQMTAVVGQETILGKRISRGYHRRTLPHIMAGDLSPISHGFVSSSFKKGLTPFELFWNIMNGREGLMDKSLRTRKSGYMQRRLVNALQDLKVKDDGTIKNSYGEIIQFKAGEDGIDPSKSDWGVFDWKNKLEIR
ncbi:MAG: DNA-directed RNA polymerase subunit A' [Candidatus Aenigmarchaeota archaeon]|nr:DNA-directed RNA polymerase subunit A' [Candidatus Aenigmarchaeota archaeon]